MTYLPIEPYLIELIERMARDEISFILAGGLGIYLKRRWVNEQVESRLRKNLFDVVPDARATDDIDTFFQLEAYLQPTRSKLRRALEELGYEPRTNYLIFEKTLSDETEQTISIDLLAPVPDDSRFKVDKPGGPGKVRRLSPREHKSSPASEQLHGYATPEAFAIDERPQSLPLLGRSPNGEPYDGFILVPHPFASLCMKIKAAADLRAEKHAQDVYLLLAMLDEQEWDECNELREQFRGHPELRSICQAVTDLFCTPDQSGCITIARNTRGADLRSFSELIRELFPSSGS